VKRIIKNRAYKNIRIQTAGLLENIRFENCTFIDHIDICYGMRKPEDSYIIRNCEFVGCTFSDFYNGGLHIGQCTLEDVLIEKCKTKGAFGLNLKHTLIRRVTIEGKLDRLHLSMPRNEISVSDFRWYRDDLVEYYKDKDVKCLFDYAGDYAFPEEVYALKDAWEKFYDETDWILDISEARIGDVEIHGKFDFTKVKFNPAIHAFISKENVLKQKWKPLLKIAPFTLCSWELYNSLKEHCNGCIVFANPYKKEWFNDKILFINELRALGIAEPGETEALMIIPPKKVKPAVNFKKPVFVFRVTVWTYDHGDAIFLANNAVSAKKKMKEFLDGLENDITQYTAKREKKYDSIANKLGEKIWHEEEDGFMKLIENL
jgi:hypothetical protein